MDLSSFGESGIYQLSAVEVTRHWADCQEFSQGLLCREYISFLGQPLEERGVYIDNTGVYLTHETHPIQKTTRVFQPYVPVILTDRLASGTYGGKFTDLSETMEVVSEGVWSADLLLRGNVPTLWQGQPLLLVSYEFSLQTSDGKRKKEIYRLDQSGFPLRIEKEIWENRVATHNESWIGRRITTRR